MGWDKNKIAVLSIEKGSYYFGIVWKLGKSEIGYNVNMATGLTRADIEELAKKDPSELSGQERTLVGLLKSMNQKGCSKENMNGGRKKGGHNWSWYFRKIMNDPEFMQTIMAVRPEQWCQNEKYGDVPGEAIAAGVITIAVRSVMDAMEKNQKLDGATLKTLEVIGKLGFGDKITHEIDGDSFFDKTELVFNVVPDRKEKES